MTIPPLAPGSESRSALAARLTEMRAAAGLSGNALAKRMKVVQSRVWKIEHGDLLPTEEDLRAWATATGRDDLAEDLVSMLGPARAEQAFAVEFRRKGGAAAYQDRLREIEGRVERIGEFAVAVIPGFLQTADYARQVFSVPSGLRSWDDSPAAIETSVDGRLRRQEILHDPAKRIQVVLGEGALRTLVVTPEVLAGQLGKLLSVARLPSVELGVIGFRQRMPTYPLGFRVYGDELIVTESIAAERYHAVEAEPREVAAFLEAFDVLRAAASRGDEAEAIIQRALDDLQ